MTSREYLKYAIDTKLIYQRRWYLTVFTRPLDDNEFVTVSGNKYQVSIDGELTDLDTLKSEPIFALEEQITITESDFKGLKQKTETTIGRYILNLLCADALDYKLDVYINEQFGINTYLDMFVAEITDDGKFTTEHIKRIGTVAAFLRQLSSILVSSAPQTMSPPPGLDKKKKEIALAYTKKNKEWSSNELLVLQYQDDVMDWVKDQFKDLPQYGITLDHKELTSFRKRFIMQGPQVMFSPDDDAVVILKSLYDGIPLDKKQFAAIMNAARIGAAGRGLGTRIGGVQAKQLIRALQGFKVDGEDCKTTDGYPMTVTKKFVNPLSFLYISVDQKPYARYSASELYDLVGTMVRVRTPLYCKQPGKEICKKCAGDALAGNDITLMAIGLGGTALKMQLSKFHNASNSVSNIKSLLENLIATSTITH